MQGAINGEGAQRARFIRGEARKMSPEQLVEKFGEENARKALQVEIRQLRAERAAGASPIDPGAQLQRQKDQQIADQAYEREFKAEIIEKQKLIDLMEKGASVDAAPMLGEKIGGRERVIPAAPAGRRLVVPSDSEFGGRKPITIKGKPLAESFSNPLEKQPCLYLLHLNLE